MLDPQSLQIMSALQQVPRPQNMQMAGEIIPIRPGATNFNDKTIPESIADQNARALFGQINNNIRDPGIPDDKTNILQILRGK